MSDARPTADEAARALYYSGRPGFTIAGVAALLDARESDLLAQVGALLAILDETHMALFNRCGGVPPATDNERRILDLGNAPLGLFGHKSDIAEAARAWEAKVRAEEREACVKAVADVCDANPTRAEALRAIRARSEAPGA